MNAFTVRQEKFEGPFDLLLTLIERRQLHIGEIALARVTDDFIGYVKGLADFPVAETAQFAYVASTLLLIKSKALLPQLLPASQFPNLIPWRFCSDTKKIPRLTRSAPKRQKMPKLI